MRKKICVLSFLFFTVIIHAQAPDIEWEKSLGGGYFENPTSIDKTLDGGYIVAGSTSSNDGDVSGLHGTVGYGAATDYWIVKLDKTGKLQWQKCLGGTGSDRATDIKTTNDGGYIIAGTSLSNDGDVFGHHGAFGSNGTSDCWIVKLDKNGNIKWQKSLGGSADDISSSINTTKDGGYIFSGYSFSNDGDVSGHHGAFGSGGTCDCWIVKLNHKGEIKWQKSLGGSWNDYASMIKETKAGDYIIAASSYSGDGDVSGHHGETGLYATCDSWIIKLNKYGKIIWQKSYGGSDGDGTNSVEETFDGGFIFAGSAASRDGDVTGLHYNGDGITDCWILKTDEYGNLEWQKTFGGYDFDNACEIHQTADSGYVFNATVGPNSDGDIQTTHLNWELCLVKLTNSGVVSWQRILGGNGTDIQAFYGLKISDDGGYITTGGSSSNDGDVTGQHGMGGEFGTFDFWVVKLKSGNILPLSFTSFSASLLQTDILLNWSTANETNNDYFIVERSNNNKDFTGIGQVQANTKNQTQNNYSFTDNNPIQGISYYRLKQVDKDGRCSYSKIVSVSFNNQNPLSKIIIKPNPSADGRFVIDLGETKTNIQLTVTNNAGKTVYHQSIPSAETMNITGLKNGFYYVHIQFDGGEEIRKIVVE